MSKHIIRLTSYVLILLMLISALTLTGISEGAASGNETDNWIEHAYFTFRIDDATGIGDASALKKCNGDRVSVANNVKIAAGEVLTLAGWLVTPDGIDSFEYAVDRNAWRKIPSGKVQTVKRNDVYGNMSQYGDAALYSGFKISLDFTNDIKDISDGKHDIFLRAVTKKGGYCEFLVMLGMTYGNADADDGYRVTVNLSRSDSACAGVVGATGYGTKVIKLGYGDAVKLGTYNFTSFSTVKVKYQTTGAYKSNVGGIEAAIGVFCAVAGEPGCAIGGRGEVMPDVTELKFAYTHTTDSSAEWSGGERTLEIDVSGIKSGRELYLSYYPTGDEYIYVTGVELGYTQPAYYDGEVLIHMAKDTADYLGGANRCESEIAYDKTAGEFTSVKLTENTNDPYIYFNIERYLKDTSDINISADTYKYIVLRVKADQRNATDLFELFLCAGSVGGPTGGCSTVFRIINDGSWRSYIVDLSGSQFDYWNNKIHGLRLDVISGNANSGDTVSIASIEFCKTMADAQASAAKVRDPYYYGDKLTDKYQEKIPSESADHINIFSDKYAECFSEPNQCEYEFNNYGDLILRLTNSDYTDPFVGFSFDKYNEINSHTTLSADRYKCIVIRLLTDDSIKYKKFQFFYYTEGHNYAEEVSSVFADYNAGGEWEYILFDMTGKEFMTGKLLGARLDWCGGGKAGAMMAISDIWFFESRIDGEIFVSEKKPDSGNETTDTENTSDTETEKDPPVTIPSAPELVPITDDKIQPTDTDARETVKDTEPGITGTETTTGKADEQTSGMAIPDNDTEAESGCNSSIGKTALFTVIIALTVILMSCTNPGNKRADDSTQGNGTSGTVNVSTGDSTTAPEAESGTGSIQTTYPETDTGRVTDINNVTENETQKLTEDVFGELHRP